MGEGWWFEGGVQHGVTQEGELRGRRAREPPPNTHTPSPFLSELEERKEGSRSEAEERRPTEERWMMVGEGPGRERCSLVGSGSLSGWIDLARVKLHHLPCISLFFSVGRS